MLDRVLAGRYRVVQTLGEGGLAKTYIAEDHFQPSHPKCVVKLLKPASNDLSFLPIASRLFITEAQILEQLGKHPQIPQLLAHFEEKKAFLIVQEFIEGHTLGSELPAGHRWSESKVVLMLKDVLKTLEFVHSYGVIHRDIKPNNLIRRHEDSQLVLIDFGAVKQIGDPRMTTKIFMTPKTISIGTQGYMPTEQARGKPRLNSDIYALGMIGIQALTGIDPINLQEDADGEVVWQTHVKVSKQLASVLSKMVRYHFKDRYQSATEVLQALEFANTSSLNSQLIPLGSQQNSVPDSESIKETKVFLENEQSTVKVICNNTLDSPQVFQKAQKQNDKVVSDKELKKTKISLNDDNLSIHKSDRADFAKTEKTLKDTWISWDKKENFVDLKTTRISRPKKQIDINSEVIPSKELENKTAFTRQDSWNLWNINNESKSLTNNHTSVNNDVDTEKISYAETNHYLLNREQKNINPEAVHRAEVRETKVSLNNDDRDRISAPSQLNETRISQNNNYNNLNLQVKQQLYNDNASSALATLNKKVDGIKLYLYSNNPLKTNVNLKSIEENLVVVSSTLWQFYQSNKPNISLGKYKKNLSIASGLALIAIGSFTIYNSLKDRKYQFEAQEEIDKIHRLARTQKHEECIQQAQIFAKEFADSSTKIEEVLNKCSVAQLAEAKSFAEQSRLKDSIDLASQIPQDTRIYPEAQQLISQWSEQIFQIANNKYQEGNLESAIAIAQAIPEDSNITTKLQATIKLWNLDWELNQKYLKAAREKLDDKQWRDAIDEAKKIKNNKFMSKQSQEIIKKAEAEIAAQVYRANLRKSPSRSGSRSNSYSRTTPRSNTYRSPSPLPPLPSSPISSPTTNSSDSKKTSIVCLNKNSPIPRCRNN